VTPAQPGASAGYSGTPLPKKLGVKPDTTLVLIGAPRGFERTLGELPDNARLRRDTRKPGERAVLFAASRAELAARFGGALELVAEGGSLWIAWPKKASGVATDLDENRVREHGLARGWVDYKVCAIDATWSGLCFARRKTSAGGVARATPPARTLRRARR
jgi:hypothetical protein